MKKLILGVNIDHVATLRQVRGGTTSYPDLLEAARLAVKGGAKQITIHLREDRRHIQDEDVRLLCKERPALINLEMAVREEMLRIAIKQKPDWVCFVPENRKELTTEGGLDVSKKATHLKEYIAKLKQHHISTSLFIEPSLAQVHLSAQLGADAVEFHTGHWVLWKGEKKKREWLRLKQASRVAYTLGLRVHAGHGLDFSHAKKIAKIPELYEVNIGHSLICYSISMGLKKAVVEMQKALSRQIFWIYDLLQFLNAQTFSFLLAANS